MIIFRKLIFFCLILLSYNAAASDRIDTTKTHEITLYVIPTLHPLDWTSPSTLFRTMNDCYFKTIGVEDNYLLGHIAVQLNTPLLPAPLFLAQTSGSMKEKLDLMFKQKVGFGIIGAALHGRIEPEQEIKQHLNTYAKRQKLSFLRYSVSEKAMQRILEFVDKYSRKMNDKYAPSDFYGGVLWPRYHCEGGGCSAFGMVLLELINATPEHPEEWRKDVKIPMKIIGGEFNKGKKIKNRTILKTTEWYTGDGKPNVDYSQYMVYEPSIMFDWIMKLRNQNDSVYKAFDDNGVPGLYIDVRNVQFDANEPLFMPRNEPNLFIEHYYKKIGITPSR